MHKRVWIACALAGALSLIALAAIQSGGAITGEVKDPAGAVVVGAQVTVRGEATGETRTATTDAQGRFKIEKLAPGRYVVSVSRAGFRTSERAIAVEDKRPAALEIKLEIAETREEVGVPGAGAVSANADPNYRALRDAALGESYAVSNLTLKRDVGTITFKSGRVTFTKPVLGRVPMAVFTGEGEFTLTPAIWVEKNYLASLTGKETLQEPFSQLVLTFTDGTYDEIKKQGTAGDADARAKDVLGNWRGRMRRNTETPRSLLEAFLTGESVENVEAELLGALYNPARPPVFNAYIKGAKHGDLRFQVRPTGGFPQMLSPEEVALLNVDWDGKEEGVLYLSHTEQEFKDGRASSNEDKRLIDAEHYRIETAIKGEKLIASAELTFAALFGGERVIGFGLLPSLRVTRVTLAGKEIGFIQEDRKQDGSFYAVLPEATVKGQKYKLTVEYEGKKVLEDQGGGNFAVGARTSWYPSVNAFNDRATFDLTFKVPKKYTLVGVGKMVKEWKEEDFAASQWVSDVPLAVAGFNYGSFKRRDATDDATKYQIEGYATSELPGYLRGAESIGGMAPSRLIEKGVVEAQNSVRLFTHWFGPAPYGRIAITQQPQPFFGQSWPTLVYLPILSFFDSTQRWQLMGGINNSLTDFIQEVTPHEVAHQWWGHIVGWASYHDQWLSEGFSDFSASLFLQYTEPKPDKYLDFWRKHRERILEKNQFGKRPNDAGPIWMGLRLNSYKNPGAYSAIVYPKGGYVLHMLRWMMYDRQTGDQKFIAMMHDFVKTHFNQNASTESFKATVEKHMTPGMDLEGNKRMDWFFRQFVYGTEVPRYRFDYTLTPEGEGVILKGKLTQSEVSDGFKMSVPVYLDFDGRVVRLGEMRIAGNTTTPEFSVKLPKRPKRVLINYHHDVLASASESVGK
jgi:hypothetical protein